MKQDQATTILACGALALALAFLAINRSGSLHPAAPQFEPPALRVAEEPPTSDPDDPGPWILKAGEPAGLRTVA